MSESNIIKFDKTRIPAKAKRREGYCSHPCVLVCEKTRMLECESCQQVMEPFDYMWEWANKDRNLVFTRDYLKKDIVRLEKKLKELKKEENNTRARVNRLKKS